MPRLRPPGPRLTPTQFVLAKLEQLEQSSLSPTAKAAGRMMLLDALILGGKCRYPMPPRRTARVPPDMANPLLFLEDFGKGFLDDFPELSAIDDMPGTAESDD